MLAFCKKCNQLELEAQWKRWTQKHRWTDRNTSYARDKRRCHMPFHMTCACLFRARRVVRFKLLRQIQCNGIDQTLQGLGVARQLRLWQQPLLHGQHTQAETTPATHQALQQHQQQHAWPLTSCARPLGARSHRESRDSWRQSLGVWSSSSERAGYESYTPPRGMATPEHVILINGVQHNFNTLLVCSI